MLVSVLAQLARKRAAVVSKEFTLENSPWSAATSLRRWPVRMRSFTILRNDAGRWLEKSSHAVQMRFSSASASTRSRDLVRRPEMPMTGLSVIVPALLTPVEEAPSRGEGMVVGGRLFDAVEPANYLPVENIGELAREVEVAVQVVLVGKDGVGTAYVTLLLQEHFYRLRERERLRAEFAERLFGEHPLRFCAGFCQGENGIAADGAAGVRNIEDESFGTALRHAHAERREHAVPIIKLSGFRCGKRTENSVTERNLRHWLDSPMRLVPRIGM